ncbi:hypothetical protein [Streptosporangium sp. NPDC002524]|uniref:hypothetical protein n=1 Tax=Streptosporangium sp. NPDC002524 TaxID=3154537 RepID=UPI00331D5EDB
MTATERLETAGNVIRRIHRFRDALGFQGLNPAELRAALIITEEEALGICEHTTRFNRVNVIETSMSPEGSLRFAIREAMPPELAIRPGTLWGNMYGVDLIIADDLADAGADQERRDQHRNHRLGIASAGR